MSDPIRVAFVASHPIQYYVPLYRAIAADGGIRIKVFFGTVTALKAGIDRDMGVAIKWSMDLTSGYEHEFLPGAEQSDRAEGFWDANNPGVGKALRRFGPDAVVVHGYSMMTMVRAIAWCIVRRVPLLITLDSSVHVSAPGMRRMLKSALFPLLRRQFSAYLTWGERSEKFLESLGVPRDQLHRTPQLLPENFALARDTPGTRATMRSDLAIADDELVLLCAGKLHPRKRIADIIQAVGALPQRPAGRIRLLIVGDGAQRGELEQMAHGLGIAAIFAGFVNLDRLPAYYLASDVFVHAAEHEPYGMVVLEAAAMGLPLVLSNLTGAIGATSIARPDDNALVFPCGDVAALTDALGRVVGDDALRARMAKRSLEIAGDHDGGESVRGFTRAVEHALATRSGGKRRLAGRNRRL